MDYPTTQDHIDGSPSEARKKDAAAAHALWDSGLSFYDVGARLGYDTNQARTLVRLHTTLMGRQKELGWMHELSFATVNVLKKAQHLFAAWPPTQDEVAELIRDGKISVKTQGFGAARLQRLKDLIGVVDPPVTPPPPLPPVNLSVTESKSGWTVDDTSQPGSPPIGIGSTALHALLHYFLQRTPAEFIRLGKEARARGIAINGEPWRATKRKEP